MQAINIIGIILLACSYSCDGIAFLGFRNDFQNLVKQFAASTTLATPSYIATRWIEQPLDHFNASKKTSWMMRYFEKLDLWRPGGPIYLFLGGEWEAKPTLLRTGVMYELGKETNGAMFYTEHRFYGKSVPNNSRKTENLKYLSARQALADAARLLKRLKRLPTFKKSKVVIFGGSYSGNLAAWMKVLYPELVDAAVASSAPVLAKKDFYEYLEQVTEDYEQLGAEGCLDEIDRRFTRYDELFQSESGIKQLKEEEQICDSTDMSKPLNKQLFFSEKSSEYMERAQYGTPESITDHCNDLMNTTRIGMVRDTEHFFWNKKLNCIDYDFDNAVEQIKTGTWIISWIYQTCTEYGYYQSTSSDSVPFRNVPVEMYYTLCTKIFGPEFDEKRIDEGVRSTNELYGGLKPNVTNVIFVNGDMDPWSRLSILEDLTYEAPAKVIPRASHCRDLLSDKEGDPEELKEARKYIKYLIKCWIGAVKYRNTS